MSTADQHQPQDPRGPQDGPEQPTRSISRELDELLAEFIAQRESGGKPDRSVFLERLDDPALRSSFELLLDDYQDASETLDGPVQPGTELGRYKVGDELGEGTGGMGKVFEAYDGELQRTVAIKVLREHTGGPFDLEGTLASEAVHLAQLQHPNIVAVHEIAHHLDATYLVMDRVEGVALADVVTRVRGLLGERREGAPRDASLLADAVGLPVPEGRRSLARKGTWFEAVARVLVEAARALEAAHGAGVLHRDLKPRNIMLRGDASPVVLDFGLAAARTGNRTEAKGRLQGSAGYLAPEQIDAGTLGDDPRSDVYQLGLVLYELLTLQPAFGGRDLSELLNHISRGEFQRPRSLDRGIPFELEAICLRAMELDRHRRYPTVKALRQDLERFLGGEELPLAARGGFLASAVRNARYAMRRRRNVVLTSLGAAAGLTLGLSLWMLQEPEREHVEWFAFSRDTEETVFDPASVGLGDILGMTLETDGERWIYAVSVYGEKDPVTWVLPMPVEPTETAGPPADGQPATPRKTWGLQLDAGKHSLLCTEIASVSEEVPFEGIWVFVSDAPRPDLEDWMAELDRHSNSGLEGVPLAMAREAFDTVITESIARAGNTRGGRVQIDAAETQVIRSQLAAADLLDDEEWPFEDPRRYGTIKPVRR